jgi:hypothetical protein
LFFLQFFWLLTTGTGFNLVGGLRKRGGDDEGAPTMVVDLGWQLGFGFEAKLEWGMHGGSPSELI